MFQQGRAALESAEERERRLRGTLVRVWHYPSFEPWRSGTQVLPRDDLKAPATVREVTWDQGEDRRRFVDPMAKIRSLSRTGLLITARDAVVSAEPLGELLWLGRQVRVSFLTSQGHFALDGDRSGISFGEYTANARIEGWGEGPSEGRSFTLWAERLRELLQGSFPE